MIRYRILQPVENKSPTLLQLKTIQKLAQDQKLTRVAAVVVTRKKPEFIEQWRSTFICSLILPQGFSNAFIEKQPP